MRALLAFALGMFVSLAWAAQSGRPGTNEQKNLTYCGLRHVADGRLATDLTIRKGSAYSTTIEFPGANRLVIKRTWACWVFPEDTWGIDGDSLIELYVDDVKLTQFTVAKGQWKVAIQSLAEHIPDRVKDAARSYKVTLKNAGGHDVFIRELWIRWLVLPD